MSVFYSKSNNAFFHDELVATLPSDAISISDDLYTSLRGAIELGGTLGVSTEGQPIVTPITSSVVPTLKAYAATSRFAHETSGIKVNDVAVSSNRNSQNLINGALQLLNSDTSIEVIEFKQPDGTWVDIPRATMIAIGIAVGTYVQACFSAERAIDLQIDNTTITTKAQIDAFAWPSTTITSSQTQ